MWPSAVLLFYASQLFVPTSIPSRSHSLTLRVVQLHCMQGYTFYRAVDCKLDELGKTGPSRRSILTQIISFHFEAQFHAPHLSCSHQVLTLEKDLFFQPLHHQKGGDQLGLLN